MLKRIRDKAKNKKGFTLVELIVVIVIILILAAVMVPSLMKYVDRAKEANCKADAATIMSQLQADYAASQATDQTGVEAPTSINGVTVTVIETVPDTADVAAGNAQYHVDANGDIDYFAYANDEYRVTWSMTDSWTVPAKIS